MAEYFDVAYVIRELKARRAQCTTWRELGEQLGCPVDVLSRIARGRQDVNRRTALALGFDLDFPELWRVHCNRPRKFRRVGHSHIVKF